jgi:hypothetical protein
VKPSMVAEQTADRCTTSVSLMNRSSTSTFAGILSHFHVVLDMLGIKFKSNLFPVCTPSSANMALSPLATPRSSLRTSSRWRIVRIVVSSSVECWCQWIYCTLFYRIDPRASCCSQCVGRVPRQGMMATVVTLRKRKPL